VKHLSGTPVKGRLLALTTDIRLDWKGLIWTNTAAAFSLTFINYGHKEFYKICPFRTLKSLYNHSQSFRLSTLFSPLNFLKFPPNIFMLQIDI
jgi:hypothetical protein